MVASTPVEIFCSYAHEDEAWLRKLETHLSLLRRQGLVSLWHDRLIAPGTDWAKDIDTYLETASVILLLVSADFFASDYCWGTEMKRALERQEAGEARVVPILVRPADWKDAPFAHLLPLPSDAKPLSTWKDKDAAFADIVAGIRHVIEDLSLLSTSVPPMTFPKIWNVPYPRNPFFLGRETELAQLRYYLQEGQVTALSQPQAISGLGGIGKTQLALEYAYRYHQGYQAVLWARAESTEALVSSYVAIAELLRLPEQEAKVQEVIVQAVKMWFQTHRGWLLILDNADELRLVRDFLPPLLGGHVLLTTRARATGRFAHHLEVDILPTELGALFLLRRSCLLPADATFEQAPEHERDVACTICEELGGLPLALDQAGAYIEETGCSLCEYQHLYQQHRTDLLAERRGQLVDDHPLPVATTWFLSFQQVEQKNLAAVDLLRLCAFLSPDAIPEEIITKGARHLGPRLSVVAIDSYLLNEAIEALCAYSLVHREARNDAISLLSVHRLVQVVLKDTMNEAELSMWAERATLAVSAAFPEGSKVIFEAWSQCERILPHVLACAEQIKQGKLQSPEEVATLLYQTGRYLLERARSKEASPLLMQGLEICEQQLGPEFIVTASTIDRLALCLDLQGKYAEAEPLYQRALALCEQQLGASDPITASSFNNLAVLYRKQGKYAEAEPLSLRALAINEQQLGPTHPLTATHLNNLATLYREQGKYEQAEPLYQRALHIREQQLRPEHPHVASSLNELATLYREQGKYAEAELLYLRALQIRESALEFGHPDTAETMHNLAWLREIQGNNEEARTWYTRALAVREQALGAHHPKTTETRTRFIALLHAMGQHEEATQLEAAQSEP